MIKAVGGDMSRIAPGVGSMLNFSAPGLVELTCDNFCWTPKTFGSFVDKAISLGVEEIGVWPTHIDSWGTMGTAPWFLDILRCFLAGEESSCNPTDVSTLARTAPCLGRLKTDDMSPIDVAMMQSFRRADGPHNDTLTIQAAIDAAAAGHGGGVVLLRAGHTFVSWSLQLRSNIKFIIDGVLATNGQPDPEWVPQAGSSRRALLWAVGVENVTITSSAKGLGEIYGNGSAWWPIRRKNYSFWAPNMWSCENCSHVRLQNFCVRDSPAWCLENNGEDIILENLTVTAPSTAPNTDGIGVGCTGGPDKPCIVRHCHVDNGDDNVAMGGSNIYVHDNYFASGHGASIGSLGYNGTTAIVSNITVRNIVFNKTSTTMRIKTWQGGHGLVSNVTYENIVVHSVGMPILITQFYCPGSQHKGNCPNKTAVVKIADVTIRNVTGTHSGVYAGEFLCSDTPGSCTRITLHGVHLTADRPAPASSNRFDCWQAHGSAVDVTPAPCLKNDDTVDLTASLDLTDAGSPLPHLWSRCLGSGHAALTMREDWRNSVRTARHELGLQMVRFHGILDE